MVRLGSWEGRSYLPPPKGPKAVGCADIYSVQDDKQLLLRLFYPTDLTPDQTFDHSSRWPKWFPSHEYSDGFLKFKLSRGVSLLSRLFRWMLFDPVVVAIQDEPISKGDQWPVVVFSHGMGSCRTTYSMLVMEMASRGFVVAVPEHGDGSGNATYRYKEDQKVEWIYYRKLLPGEEEDPIRLEQQKLRESECLATLDILRRLHEGLSVKLKSEDSTPLDLGCFKGRLDLQAPIISGHSFGGMTVVQCMALDQSPFKLGVAFDSWIVPFGPAASDMAKRIDLAKLLFINNETFQGRRNLGVMRAFETQGNVQTIKHAHHYCQCDLPTMIRGSYAHTPFRWLDMGGVAGEFAHDDEDEHELVEKPFRVSRDLFMAFVRSNLNRPASPEDETFTQCRDRLDEHLIVGTSFKE